MDLPSVVVPRSMDYLRRLDEARELQAAHAAGEDAGDLEIDRLATEMALALEAPLRAGMRRWHRRMLAYGERLVAPALWERLQKYDAAQRKGVVRQVKAFRSAGLVELLCRKSIQAAALPFVDGKRDPRLLWGLCFNLAENLFEVGRFSEAEPLLPGVQELAERMGNRLDFGRYVWLGARLDAGLGRLEKAEAGFQQVRRDFLARGIAFDAALASLELAVLDLEQGRSAEVREIAAELLPVFKAQKVDREALATVHLFCDAARQETLTSEMARDYLKKLRKAGRPSPPAPKQA